MSRQLDFSFRSPRPPKLAVLHATAVPRKKQDPARFKRWGRWAALIAFSLVLVGAGTHLAMRQLMRKTLYENPRYALRRVTVEGSAEELQRAVQQAARRHLGENLMKLDLKRLQVSLAALPYVASVDLEKRLPDTLLVRVRERQPLLRIVATHSEFRTPQVFYLDRDRVVLKPRQGEVVRSLPELVGLPQLVLEPGQIVDQREVTAAVELLKYMELTPLRNALDLHTIEIISALALRMHTQAGSIITFRIDSIPEQLSRLQEVLEYSQLHQRAVRTVDLTPERNVPVTFLN